MKLQILKGPDRLAFVNGLFIDFEPESDSRGRNNHEDALYRGEPFLTVNEKGEQRTLPLVIMGTRRKRPYPTIQKFHAALYAGCDEFRDLLMHNSMNGGWIDFEGELDFSTGKGFLEEYSE